jgi:hypothetical protein
MIIHLNQTKKIKHAIIPNKSLITLHFPDRGVEKKETKEEEMIITMIHTVEE